MGLFDKVARTAANVGKSTLNSAVKVGSSVNVAAQDQSELLNLKTQLNVIEQDLNASYVQIGRRFVDYVIASGEMPGIDVSDILKLMEPKLEQKQKFEQQIIELEKKIKNNAVLREKQAAEQVYLDTKAKLDKALAMEVIDQAEYDEKIAAARKQYDNFEQIRKIEQQYDMKLITKAERDEKIKALSE